MELLVILIGGAYLHWAFSHTGREDTTALILYHLGFTLLLMAIGASIIHLWF